MSKTIFITGTSTGFGRDTALTLALAGHNVFAAMREPFGKNSIHAEALQTKDIHIVEIDVTDDKSVEHAVDAVVSKAGHIDVLINNAGVAAAGVTEAFSTQQMAAVFDVNVMGMHRVTRAVLPLMRERQDGLIVNIGSILGRVTFPFFGIYGASKYAVEALSDSLRYEVSQLGIDVTLIQPSAYPTQMYSSAIQPDDADCAASYGDTGKIPDAMFAQFMSMFESENSPHVHDVAAAITQLIDTPAGKRPTRAVVGASFGADSINSAVEPIQRATVKSLGLGHLDSVNT